MNAPTREQNCNIFHYKEYYIGPCHSRAMLLRRIDNFVHSKIPYFALMGQCLCRICFATNIGKTIVNRNWNIRQLNKSNGA